MPGVPLGARAEILPTRADPALRLVLGGGLFVVAGLAWAWTVATAGMPACHQLALGDFVLMWTVMMTAMMLPSLVPVVLAYVALARPRSARPGYDAAAFVAGYLVVWSLLGVPVHAGLAAIEPALPAGRTAVWLGGLLLVGCGVYQLTPLKDACLRHCRLPQLFLGHHWRDGTAGGLALGVHHGLYCTGCCASLMIVLLVVGMMNLAWMVGLTAVIYLEKVVPGGRAIGRVAGVALCAVGAARMLG